VTFIQQTNVGLSRHCRQALVCLGGAASAPHCIAVGGCIDCAASQSSFMMMMMMMMMSE